ncbi:MAG: UV DNA damage repair endonuclease UvsE, partial [Bacilli bacterium]
MLTYSHYKKLGQELGLNKLNKVIISNFKDLEEILRYNKSNNIYFYRLTSKLIPLATHNEVLFDYISDYKDAFGNIGKIIKESKMRVDTHPDQYCVLNSIKDEVVKSSKEILLYHKEMFKAMGIDGKIIIHIGSGAYGKKKSIERFKENFYSLDEEIRKLIIIENDDKVFNAYDTLKLCKELGIPMVLDYHHYLCNKTSK